MHKILISPETFWPDEIQSLVQLFDAGLEFYHLRKPNAQTKEVETFVKKLPQEFHDKIILHYHFELADAFDWKGFHFNKRNKDQQTKLRYLNKLNSYSAHAYNEAKALINSMNYQFLSPIFDSISKTGYHSSFDLEEVKNFIEKNQIQIVALGGIKPKYFPLLKNCGFYGAAVLGFIWNENYSINQRIEKFKELKC